ncbi:MAG: Arc family DNA binding domain-containing protein [Niabella sp.]
MSDKKSFILRIDADTYALLEKWAADDFRSVNGQIEFLINSSLIKAGRKNKTKAITPSAEKKK